MSLSDEHIGSAVVVDGGISRWELVDMQTCVKTKYIGKVFSSLKKFKGIATQTKSVFLFRCLSHFLLQQVNVGI